MYSVAVGIVDGGMITVGWSWSTVSSSSSVSCSDVTSSSCAEDGLAGDTGMFGGGALLGRACELDADAPAASSSRFFISPSNDAVNGRCCAETNCMNFFRAAFVRSWRLLASFSGRWGQLMAARALSSAPRAMGSSSWSVTRIRTWLPEICTPSNGFGGRFPDATRLL